jgi:hypothetical protein
MLARLTPISFELAKGTVISRRHTDLFADAELVGPSSASSSVSVGGTRERHGLEDSIEIHTVELAKYNGSPNEVRRSSVLEQWAYWIKNSSEHTVEELRELLPGLEFLQATGELNAIREITEEKQMYDAREKASLDIQSNLIDARQEGRQEGQAIGLEKGQAIGLEKGQAIGLEKGQAIGRIRLLQELLDVPVASDESLHATSLEQLTSIMEELQTKLRQRGV